MTRTLRWVVRSAGVAVVVAAALAVPTTATASTRDTPRSAQLPPPPVLSMELTHNGFEVPGPNPRPAGLVTFRASTADRGGHFLTLFALRPGVTLETAIQEFMDSASPDPAIALPATRALFRDVIFRGGLKVLPVASLGFTVSLDPGTYYVVEAPIGWVPGRPPYVLKALEVIGPANRARLPRADERVVVAQCLEQKRFVASARWSRTGNVLVTNMAPDPHELILDRVVPGTTNADLRQFFGPREPGDEPVNPFVPNGSVGGLLSITPGEWAVLHLDVPAGEYAMLSFIRDPNTGVPSTRQGMAKTVRIV